MSKPIGFQLNSHKLFPNPNTSFSSFLFILEIEKLLRDFIIDDECKTNGYSLLFFPILPSP